MIDYTYSECGTFRGYVDIDQFADDPRNWDNVGRMVCFHNKYGLGDGHNFDKNDYESWDEVESAIKDAGGVLILPLGLYDHSGISMYVGKRIDPWDSGQVGFIFVTQEDLDREGIDIVRAEEILRGEVKTYDAYLKGEVYIFGVEQQVNACSCGECKEWESVEFNGGYIDHQEAERDMKELLSKFDARVAG